MKIPAGIEDGMQVRLTGEGSVGNNGGPPGNLYVAVSVIEHAFFRRDGVDLLIDLPMNFVQATLGTEVQILTLNGSEPLKVPPGTQPGTAFRIKGKGIPHLRNQQRGDLVVKVNLEVPTSTDPEQRQALEELARIMHWNDGYDYKDKGLFGKIKDAFGGPS